MSCFTKVFVAYFHTLLLFSLFIMAGCDQPQQQQTGATPPPPQVTVATPLVQEVTDWDEFTGRLYAVESVEVRPRVSGYLQSINFVEGSIVNKGDLLYVIDPRPYQAVLDQGRADVTRTRAALDLAENDLARAERLYKSRAISEEEVDSRSKKKREALASLEAARADVESAARCHALQAHQARPGCGLGPQDGRDRGQGGLGLSGGQKHHPAHQ